MSSLRVLSLLTSCLSAWRLVAQSSGLPLPADVRLTEVRLPTPNQTVSVRYAIVDRGLTYFSPIFAERAEINGQPLVDASGSLRIPSGSPQLLTVTFRDPEKGPNGRVELRDALSKAPDVLQETAGIPPQPVNSALVATERKVALILRDPLHGNLPLALTGESTLADQEGNPTPKVDFVLDAATLKLLQRVRAEDVEIAFFQDYPARFETNNVVITVENLQRQVGNLRQSLAPIPAGAPGGGGAAGIVLDAAFGSGVTQNGTLDKSSLVSDFIRRNVSFNVRYRNGAALDTPLVERLVDFALSRASDFLQKSPFEGTNTFVTLLLRDDIQITTALGRLDEFATQMETGQTDELFTKLIEAVQSNQSVNVSAKATVYASGYGSGKANLAVNLTRSEYLEQLRQEFHQSFRNASAWFKGSIPYLPGIRFSTSMGVDNIRWDDFRSALTEFTTGTITLYRPTNLRTLAGRQEGQTLYEMFDHLIAQNEEYLKNLSVPLVQVGSYATPSSAFDSSVDWVDQGAGNFYHDVVVIFPRPFESKPEVVTSLALLHALNSAGGDKGAPEYISIRTEALEITRSQFKLRFDVYNAQNRKLPTYVARWKLAASWVATGTARLGASQQAAYQEFRNHLLNQQAVMSSEKAFAATPWISSAVVPEAGNRFTVTFTSVPRCAYRVESSPDLQQWFAAGTTVAGPDALRTTFQFQPDEQFPQLFFRVTRL